MATRRLVAIMLVLLVASSIAAALAPVEPRTSRDEQSTATSPTTTTTAEPLPARPGAAPGSGRVVRARLDAGGRSAARAVRAEVGDQLQLLVRSARPVTVTIPALGPSENAGRFAPARFSLLLERPGSFAVRLLESGRTVGRLVVERRREDAGG